jgi:hypothetical protein
MLDGLVPRLERDVERLREFWPRVRGPACSARPSPISASINRPKRSGELRSLFRPATGIASSVSTVSL